MSWKELIFGKPLRSDEEEKEQVGVLSGVPVLGLDGLASAAYGPEAALTVLLPLGVLASGYIGPLTAAIVAVLLMVGISYRQTIAAYPQGGGSFTVAKENLGRVPGLLAATALCIDYVLNVAVAISAGVGALVSALPALLPHTLGVCLAILAMLTIVNLRGVRSAGLLFMMPTGLFVCCLGGTLLLGVVKSVLAGGHPAPVVPPPKLPVEISTASLWLLLRAFASGCSALTGVEAVSNAVPIFRKPKVKRAEWTLTIVIALLAFLLAGIAFVSRAYGITATPSARVGYQSVLSILVAAVAGHGAFYSISIAAMLLLLTLSANTSFAGFPRVCRLLALDEYLPAAFAHRGRRLVYTQGIVSLALLAGTLLLIFRGITDRLIPLFAIGAFLAFTLSQLGMVAHWRRQGGAKAWHSLALNALGASATGATLIIIAISKFMEGAWITLLLIPTLMLIFAGVRRHHERVDRATDADGTLEFDGLEQPLVVIPIQRLNRVTRKALRFGATLSCEVQAVQVLAEELKEQDLTQMWCELVEQPALECGVPAPKLVVVPSPYREFFGPLLDYVSRLAAEHPDRPIAVVIPELVQRRWYHLLFPHRTTLLRDLLLLRGGQQMVIVTTPWYVSD